MVERFGRIEEARGSIPLTSTPSKPVRPTAWWRALRPFIAATTFLLLAACATSAAGAQYEGLVVAEPFSLPQLVLTDTDGNPFDLIADTADNVALIYFGFTHCPDICNIQLNQLNQVLSRPGAPVNVDVLFVTVDPERDTPSVIRTYLDRFSPDFVGLTADDAQLTRLQNEVGALAALRQPSSEKTATPPHEHADGTTHSHDTDKSDTGANTDSNNTGANTSGNFQPGTDNYEVGHDARVFAFAPDGVGYTQYPHPTRQSQYAHDLPLLAAITPTTITPAA